MLVKNTIRFRTFQLTDVNAIQSLMEETVSTCYGTFPLAYRQHWIDDHHSRERILTDASEGYTLVVEYQDNIIGTGSLLQDEIQSVFIHPDFQQLGLGTQLMIRLEEYARQRSIQEIQLYALTLSRSFFEKLGYHTISEHQFKDPHLRQFKYFIMEKRLELPS